MTNYYKVCTALPGGALLSYVFPSSIAIEYVFGEVTKPRPGDGPLAVFDSKEAVADFTEQEQGGDPVKVFECTAENVREPDADEAVWSGNSYMAGAYLPAGTLLANSVTLTRELTEEELIS